MIAFLAEKMPLESERRKTFAKDNRHMW
jgi:hypothetical protein